MKKYLLPLIFALFFAADAYGQQPVRLYDRLDEDNDAVRVYGSDDGGTTKRIMKTDSGGAVQVDIESAPTLQVQSNSANIATQTTAAAIQTAVELIDDAVHASDAALSKGIVIFCQFDDTSPGTTTENSVRPIRCSTRREVFTQIRDAAGNERGANVNASNQLSVSVDNSLTVTANAGTNLNTSTLLTTSAHDAAFGTAGTADAQVRSVQGVSGMTPVVISGANANSKINCTQNAFLNMTTATTTEIVALSGSTIIYVCHYSIVSNGGTATTVTFVDGTGSNCATSQSSRSAGILLTAATNTVGISAGSGEGMILKTSTAGDALCVTSSGAATIGINISYAQF